MSAQVGDNTSGSPRAFLCVQRLTCGQERIDRTANNCTTSVWNMAISTRYTVVV